MFMSEETYGQLNLIMMKTDENVKGMNNIIELMNFTDEAFRNYHYLWYSYIINKSNLKLFCMNLLIPLPPNGLDLDMDFNCTADPLRYLLADANWHNEILERIREDPALGKIFEANSIMQPPCLAEKTKIKELKIEPICNFLRNISQSKSAFLNLMKFTKQSPVYIEDLEFHGINNSSTKHGYTINEDNKVPVELTTILSIYDLYIPSR